MKKLLGIVVLGLLLSGNAYADPRNPSKEWLKTQNVNSLTQQHGYALQFVTMTTEDDFQYTQYHLTRSKNNMNDGKYIVITCSYRGISFGHHCFLP